VHFVGLFFVFIIENARSKKQNILYLYSCACRYIRRWL